MDRYFVASAELLQASGVAWGASARFTTTADAQNSAPQMPDRGDGESLDRAQSRQLRLLSVAGSLVLHASLMLILAAWLIPHSAPARGTVIDTTMMSDEPSKEALEVSTVDSPAAADSESTTQSLFATSASSAATANRVKGDLPEVPVGLRAGATDNNGGSTGESPAKVGFFGLEAEGTSFVFVVDQSGSMDGSRFSRARSELIRALDGLTPQQKFFVIFYNHRALPMYVPGKKTKLMPASRGTLRRARRWIGDQAARGGTFPDPALEMALSMKPDVIFFLSDGAFQRTARTTVKAANTHGTHIHTIAFEFDGGKLLLKGIAEDNDGRYRFVE